MAKKYELGDVLTGKVTGIQPYGAFVALDDDTQGLVHISEITYGFVKDVSEFLSVGQEVEVKVLEIDEVPKKLVYRFVPYKSAQQQEKKTHHPENHYRIEWMNPMRMVLIP